MKKLNQNQKRVLATGALLYLIILISPLFIESLFSNNVQEMFDTTDVELLGQYLLYIVLLTIAAA